MPKSQYNNIFFNPLVSIEQEVQPPTVCKMEAHPINIGITRDTLSAAILVVVS